MRYIDGHDAIEHAEVNGEDKDFIRKMTDYIEDAKAVVLCKDCTKVREEGGHANCNGWLVCRYTGKTVNEDDFCSRGEE